MSHSKASATLQCHPSAQQGAEDALRGADIQTWCVVAVRAAVGSQTRAGLETRLHELFISYGREASINNTSALSHSASVCLQINISFSRNTHRLVDK